jgi:hypothetical protein
MTIQADRRGRERAEIVGQLWGSLGVIQPLRTIGRGGALVEAGQSLPLLSVHRMRLALGDVEGNVEVRVCRVEPMVSANGRERYLIGLEFVQLPLLLVERIDQLVEGGVVGLDRSGGQDDA